MKEIKKVDALRRDTEDEAKKTTKVENNKEEKNESYLADSSLLCTFEDNNLPSLSENGESASDVIDKEPAQTSKIVTNNEWMKKKMKIMKKEIKNSRNESRNYQV